MPNIKIKVLRGNKVECDTSCTTIHVTAVVIMGYYATCL